MLRLAVFFISNFGYYQVFNRKLHIHISFLPLLTIALQIMVLFTAGVLNMLPEAASLLLIFGVALFIWDLCCKRFSEYRAYLDWSYVYMAVFFVLLLAALRGRKFSGYDDFSHWAAIVKEMLLNNRYPSFMDGNRIMFQSYPPGSATYIYYFCKAVAPQESMQMLAQAFMLIAALMPLFSFSKKQTLWLTVYVTLFTSFSMVYLIRIYSLMVDTLLALFGMGAIAYVYKECYLPVHTGTLWNGKRLLPVIPLLIAEVLLKNSGIFFVIPVIAMLFSMMKTQRSCRKQCITAVLAPAAALFIWKKHCQYLFWDAEYSKHAMTMTNYASVISGKTGEDCRNIVLSVLRYTFTRKVILYMCAFLLLTAVLTWCLNRDDFKRTIRRLAFAAGAYLVYVVGICGMYLFSMPVGEAMQLAAIERYMQTVDLLVFYVVSASLIELYGGLSGQKGTIAIVSAMCMALVLWGGLTEFSTINVPNDTSFREWIENRIEEYEIPEQSSYFIYAENSDYCGFICRYLLWSENVANTSHIEKKDLTRLSDYQYIFLKKQDDPIMNQWIREHYPEQFGSSIIDTRLN